MPEPDLHPLARSFERYLRASNRSERTVGNYLDSIRQLQVFMAPLGRELPEVTRRDLEAFFVDQLTRLTANSAATRHKHLKVLFRWLYEEDEVEADPMARLKAPLVPDKPVPVVPQDALRRLLDACAGKHFDARRDMAIIMLLLDTGFGFRRLAT